MSDNSKSSNPLGCLGALFLGFIVIAVLADSNGPAKVKATSNVVFTGESLGKVKNASHTFLLNSGILSNKSSSVDSGKVTVSLISTDFRGGDQKEIASADLGIIEASGSAPDQALSIPIRYRSSHTVTRTLKLQVTEAGKEGELPLQVVYSTYEFKGEEWTNWWDRPHVIPVAIGAGVVLVTCIVLWGLFCSSRHWAWWLALPFVLSAVAIGPFFGRHVLIVLHLLWIRSGGHWSFWLWSSLAGGLWFAGCALLWIGRGPRGGRIAQGWQPASAMGGIIMALFLVGVGYSKSLLPGLLDEYAATHQLQMPTADEARSLGLASVRDVTGGPPAPPAGDAAPESNPSAGVTGTPQAAPMEDPASEQSAEETEDPPPPKAILVDEEEEAKQVEPAKKPSNVLKAGRVYQDADGKVFEPPNPTPLKARPVQEKLRGGY